jgi:OOP family OmpA-OmpF porin
MPAAFLKPTTMKKSLLFAIAGTGSLWAAQAGAQTSQPYALAAGAETSKMYVTVDAGAAWQQNLNAKGNGEISFDTGFRSDVALGYNFCKDFSAELETGVIDNSINSIAGRPLSSYGASADVYEIPMLVNAIYRVPLKGAWTPYVGAGVGGVATCLDAKNVPLLNPSYSSTDFTFAYQATAGLKYAVSKNIELGIAYKFIGTTDHNWSDDNVNVKTDGSVTHAVLASFTWKF